MSEPTPQTESRTRNSDVTELTWGELQAARIRLMMGLSWRLLAVGGFLFFAAMMVYLAIFEDFLWIIGAVIGAPIALGFAALFMFAEEGLRSVVLDLGAKPITKETPVSSKREESWSNEYGSGVNYYMRFASLGGEFQVSKREFERFYMGERVLVSYYPRSKTVARIRDAAAPR